MSRFYDIMHLCPVPPCTVPEIFRIATTKTTDFLTLVKCAEGTARNSANEGENICDFELIHSSPCTPGKLATVAVSAFGIAKTNRLMASIGQPMFFFNLSVVTKGGMRTINHYAREQLGRARLS